MIKLEVAVILVFTVVALNSLVQKVVWKLVGDMIKTKSCPNLGNFYKL